MPSDYPSFGTFFGSSKCHHGGWGCREMPLGWRRVQHVLRNYQDVHITKLDLWYLSLMSLIWVFSSCCSSLEVSNYLIDEQWQTYHSIDSKYHFSTKWSCEFDCSQLAWGNNGEQGAPGLQVKSTCWLFESVFNGLNFGIGSWEKHAGTLLIFAANS